VRVHFETPPAMAADGADEGDEEEEEGRPLASPVSPLVAARREYEAARERLRQARAPHIDRV